MFYHDRKGQEKSYLVYIIMALVGFIVVIIIMNIFVINVGDITIEQTCRASILARAKAVLKLEWFGGTFETTPVVPITCKTKDKTLEGDKEQVLMQISELSARCWWMFLNGEYQNLFDSPRFLNKRMCFPCYTFNIKTHLESPITPDEIIQYMATHDYIPASSKKEQDKNDNKEKEKPEEGITYLYYIQSLNGDGVIGMREKLVFVGDQRETYSINLMSPDISLYMEYITDPFYGYLNIFESDEFKNKKEELKKANQIYIEDLNIVDKSGYCERLESI
ncbi:hypothetical protein AUJ83_01970 [Candidatus Woesearchaeota archaeon CG1_02_33_12]|nr:MAG: hypothetical protein AUJ83_01970 [Candidatus Woesearchaeota archaeon CG1_02_33_12]PIN78621.1 MAG: hypothetical protein COV14_02825 [Candidatus Woesearchaeota archaeon CG10_big_fil_rev_8_21_14_0_10_33_12]PIU72357.1 MAG: hypothetical protein COS79_03365 [Candidatus Woesearchaeota archaeon CG06_land_8_20_14_3_00_33_13]